MELADALARPARPPEPTPKVHAQNQWYDPDSVGFERADYVPLNPGARFSKNAETPSRWSSELPAIPCK